MNARVTKVTLQVRTFSNCQVKFLTVLRSRAPRSPCVSIYFFKSCSQNCQVSFRPRDPASPASVQASCKRKGDETHLKDQDELGLGMYDIV